MTIRAQRSAKGIEIALAIGLIDEEVKHGPVVPERVAPLRLECRHILMQQSDPGSFRPEALLKLPIGRLAARVGSALPWRRICRTLR
jgi:hypothetical protein